MSADNEQHLRERLNALGFWIEQFPQQEWEQGISSGQEQFQVQMQLTLDEWWQAKVSLLFIRSTTEQGYSWDRYTIKLQKGQAAGMDREQTFYPGKPMSILLKEACNLLLGRAINKDLTDNIGTNYNAWVQLNFKEKDRHDDYRFLQYRDQYGFNLEKVLLKYPIRELKTEEEKAALLRSLKMGNLQAVAFEIKGRIHNMLITANPQYKTINIFPVH